MKLAQLQQKLVDYILKQDEAIIKEIASHDLADAKERLEVYKDAYFLRLCDNLKKDFPVFLQSTFTSPLVGEVAAKQRVRGEPKILTGEFYINQFLKNFISKATHLHAVSKEFLAWLTDKNPLAADIARIELAVDEILDAANSPSLSFTDLQHIAQTNLLEHVFYLHPAVKIIFLNTNALDIYQAAQVKHTLPLLVSCTRQALLIWRQASFVPGLRVLDEQELELLKLVQTGKNFTEICDVIAEKQQAIEAAQTVVSYLQRWVEAGILVG